MNHLKELWQCMYWVQWCLVIATIHGGIWALNLWASALQMACAPAPKGDE